ncbi:YceI family protein [Vibrio parahaemolyticus]|nr:YceI family protein [Vibrio parahaemolyticus]MCR9814411.1 YceI family protein [Vibrio parahaemolyticus]MDF4316726.1 YceI family protein [Vibrio parahaemolyticus]MDF5088618.1 YceI family protein [Vibrio parahaemolyticus]MDF5409486.1 YceI family protein [Vibrio parahaemolyticus]MDG2824935.1 YceI family protein [Vibrio parahaemolyticus]
MKKSLIAAGLFLSMAAPLAANAADYKIDTSGAHASINFAVSHLGYSITQGRFNDFEGTFSYDENNIEASKVKVVVDTTSLDSNHAERDKHIRSAAYFGAFRSVISRDYPITFSLTPKSVIGIAKTAIGIPEILPFSLLNQ